MNWHLECAVSGIGHFFTGTLAQAAQKSRELLAVDRDFSQMVIWRTSDNAEAMRIWKDGRTWVNGAFLAELEAG